MRFAVSLILLCSGAFAALLCTCDLLQTWTQRLNAQLAICACEDTVHNNSLCIWVCRLVLHYAEALYAAAIHRPVPDFLPADHRTAIRPLLRRQNV